MTLADSYSTADVLRDALVYINHVGANWTMRGQPHPQQWLVDRLEAELKRCRGPNYRQLIEDHNAECIRLCDNRKRCGYEKYATYMDCGNCTKDWVIDIPPTATVQSIPEDK